MASSSTIAVETRAGGATAFRAASLSFRKRGSAAPSFCECGGHAFAALTQGFVALVSPEDAGQFAYHWSAQLTKDAYVIVTRKKTVGVRKQRTVVLAREILGMEVGGVVDHVNRNPLDNRRNNLRPCTSAENSRNKKASVNNKLGVKGVWPFRGKYRVAIKVSGKRHDLGVYRTLDEARLAYAVGAFWFHRDFARVK